MNSRYYRIASFLLLFWGTIAVAASLPAWYPASFPYQGRVDSINYRANDIVINDQYYPMTSNVRVHSLYVENDTRFAVRTGAWVGFRTGFLDNGKRAVTELWVLPSQPIYTE